ncbi:Predicted arabinose efflux permease, MFS family [Actinoplanes derwentensis]|uniref:Predicted arabinose efflux permease, MFS family n=2 Tax=Actinoplanes derwentensis TaxID=113562 RepID=A0A1H1WJG2_9ACTN|nr:MFS transporter [Actinoplanes derwentensis]GID87462.1 MFS transporter [Actinoplanes derwentensis]SDS97458.1 Predicted arabinose efflux permease, MFS family [Actinoplanes derwentensis]
MTAEAQPKPATALLRERVFRHYWSAHVVSMVGDQISLIAIPLLAVLTIGAGAAEMGYLTAAALLPNLFLSLLAGAWVDRRGYKRKVMIGADLGRAALLLVVPVLAFTGVLNLWHLCALSFAIGTLTVFYEVADGSLFAAVVRRPDYIAANSLTNGARAMSFVAGPSVGGVLVQVLTAPFALVADVLSYLGSALLLTRIAPPESPGSPSGSGGWGISSGLTFIARSAVLRQLLLGVTVINLFNYVFHALLILYVTTVLGLSPGMLGAVIGIASIGGLVGAAVTGPLTRRFGIGPVVVLGYVAFPLPLILIPLADGPPPMVIGMLLTAEFFSALGVMILDIGVGSLQTAATPVSRLSLVKGAQRTVNYGVRPIGALLGGFLGERIGVHPALWIGAVGALTGVFFVLFSPVPRMRELPDA